jgi:hypothetical protein
MLNFNQLKTVFVVEKDDYKILFGHLLKDRNFSMISELYASFSPDSLADFIYNQIDSIFPDITNSNEIEDAFTHQLSSPNGFFMSIVHLLIENISFVEDKSITVEKYKKVLDKLVVKFKCSLVMKFAVMIDNFNFQNFQSFECEYYSCFDKIESISIFPSPEKNFYHILTSFSKIIRPLAIKQFIFDQILKIISSQDTKLLDSSLNVKLLTSCISISKESSMSIYFFEQILQYFENRIEALFTTHPEICENLMEILLVEMIFNMVSSTGYQVDSVKTIFSEKTKTFLLRSRSKKNSPTNRRLRSSSSVRYLGG